MKRILLLLSFSLFTMQQSPAGVKHKLIYIGDPMCSWCYGFMPELSAALDELGPAYELEIVLGGLRPYNKESMYELSDFLKKHWEQVSKTSKQEFKYDILKRKDILYDTEPSCRAVLVVKQLRPDLAYEFFKRAQISFYKENNNPLLSTSYTDIAVSLGIDSAEFTSQFESQEAKDRIKGDFKLAQDLGVRGFPTLLIFKNNKYRLVSNGYTTKERILLGVKAALSGK